MLKLIFAIFVLQSAYSNCSKTFEFLFNGIAPMLEFGYKYTPLRTRDCLTKDSIGLIDLVDPKVIFHEDFKIIAQNVFEKAENSLSLDPQVILINALKKTLPNEYQKMKELFFNNINILANLDPHEIVLYNKNPVAAMWVMYNGYKAKLISEKIQKEKKDKKKEESDYYGKGDALRHILASFLSARFGFQEFAKEYINSHETVRLKEYFDKPNPHQDLSNDNALSSKIMEYLLVKNKETHDNNRRIDHQMDLLNNALGFRLAQEHYCVHDEEQIIKIINEHIENGDAYIIDSCQQKSSKLIKSNEKFSTCNTDLYENDKCTELSERFKITTPFEEVKKMIDSGVDPMYINCGYIKSLNDILFSKYIDDPIIGPSLQEKKVFYDDNKDNQGMFRLFEISGRQSERLCAILKQETPEYIKTKKDCTQIYYSLGFESKIERDREIEETI